MSTKEAAARAAGFTRAIFASSDMYDLELLVRPDADLDGAFKAFDLSEQEWLTVNGWLFIIEEDTEFAPEYPVTVAWGMGAI